VTKDKLNASIDKNLLKKFNEYCNKNLINKSKQIEDLMKKFVEGKK
jgi:metal-responsive CopG/Arc/MetJ family transcriptional regulator